MRKRIIALIVALSVVLVGGGTVLAATVADIIRDNKQDAQLKAEKEKTYIADLFHDQGHIYMTPDEPKAGEDITLRLRTERYNVTRAQIQYTTDEGLSWNTVDMKFEKQDDTGYYDIWKGKIPAEGDLIYYRFIAGNKDLINTVYYDTKGVAISEGKYTQCWKIVPGHSVPEWAKGALWYSLLPDAFYNGNTTNDKQISGENSYVTWNKLRKNLADKYGGDLDGIEEKLDHIESLNADAIYMNPISKSYQNAGYGAVHFDEVESSFGNEEDLVSLSDAIHDRDMKLMGDVVLTFALVNSYYFNKDGRWPVAGAYQSEESEWNEMFPFYNWPDHYMLTWSSPATNLNTEAAKNLFYANKDSYLLKYANIFDGYRFDCGGWLWGTTETDDLDSYTFVKEIREALHSVNEDFYLLTESDWDNMNTATWDSAWNISYMPKLQDYAKGLINETLMTEAMYNYEMTLPRNVALCMQNMMSDHDSTRVLQHDDYMYNAAVLIQMTYLGSPSIYYGEEVDYIRENEDGTGAIQSFYAMDWDESNWDQARLNFYKATGELRQEYSCLKTGVVNMLGNDITQNTITFGRWDENGAAITVASQNEDIITMEIPVKRCDIENGTVMTDWYTGAQYVVEDGKITADIIPGGTVIVTGEKSSTYRQTFEQTAIGSVSDEYSIITTNSTSYIMDGKGKISDSKDDITFVNTVAYNDFSVFANIRGDGEGTFMIRNGLGDRDEYYAAVVDGEKLSIVARTISGKEVKILVETDCTKNTYIKLERTSKNEFQAYRTEVTDGNLGSWETIEGSKISIGMNNEVTYGFAPIKGEMRVNNITFAQLGRESTFDTFDEEVTTSLFDNINADFVSVSDGSLTITNSSKNKLHYLLTNSMEDDWTFKVKMNHSPTKGEYAGVVSRQDENNYIVAGRTMIDGESVLFIGKATNGSIAIYDSVKELVPEDNIIIQLQRIGAYYSAVYSIDSGASWKYIGRIYSNFCNERVGVLVAGKSSASFDWVSFGDSINDGVSVNTPQSPVAIDTTYTNDNTTEECKYEYLTGDWTVVTGGWSQNDKKGFAQASAVNKLFTGLYAEATIDVTSGDGWAGFAFGKATPFTEQEDGFLLKYYNNGSLVLMNKGEKIAECELKASAEDAMRIVLEASDGRIIVYAGQDAVPVMSLNNTGYYNGYVSFCTDGAAAEFRNFHHGSTSASWSWISGNGIGVDNSLTTTDTSTTERQIHTISTLVGYSFTNFVCTTKFAVEKVNAEMPCASGLLLCASEGKSASTDGVFVYLDGEGRLVLSVEGTEKAAYTLPKNSVSAKIMVVKQNGTYQVFLKGVEQPVLEYTEEFNRGGVLSAYTINGSGTFIDIAIENMQPGQDYTTTNVAGNWLNGTLKSYSDNFNTKASSDNYYLYNKDYATFAVTGGILRCYDSNNWSAGATVREDMYSDFTMEFKLFIDSSQDGWMSIGMRKHLINGNHNNSGLSLMISSAGDIFFFSSETRAKTSEAKIADFKIDGWNQVKIVARGSNVTAYVNGKQMATYTDNSFYEGFINFTSGMHNFAIDDLKITPMK